MSNVPKFLAVCAYIDKIDTNDVEGAHQYVTDDFVYEAEPKPVGILGASYHDEDGFNQASYKVFRDTVAKHITQKITIENITGNPQTEKITLCISCF
ncbi:hypothetical protein DFH29DRAFT_1009457 [Suillus ampliporus]|nr:hypothetical protein DFH29DRAFT_1009457 [Suillus ampliporus]